MIGRSAVLVEVEPVIPALARDLDDGVDLIEKVVPQLVDALGLRKYAGNADDRNVRRARSAQDLVTRRGVDEPGPEQLMGTNADRTMQVGYGFDVLAQRRDLTNHVHALLPLLARGNMTDVVGRSGALLAFACQTQPTERQALEILAHRIAGQFLGFELTPARQKLLGKRAHRRSACVAWATLQRHRPGACYRGILEFWNNRPRADDLLREKIGCAHQHANLHAALDEWRGHGGHDRGGTRVMHAASKQHLDFGVTRSID